MTLNDYGFSIYILSEYSCHRDKQAIKSSSKSDYSLIFCDFFIHAMPLCNILHSDKIYILNSRSFQGQNNRNLAKKSKENQRKMIRSQPIIVEIG